MVWSSWNAQRPRLQLWLWLQRRFQLRFERQLVLRYKRRLLGLVAFRMLLLLLLLLLLWRLLLLLLLQFVLPLHLLLPLGSRLGLLQLQDGSAHFLQLPRARGREPHDGSVGASNEQVRAVDGTR
jgi:hypothetical protein